MTTSEIEITDVPAAAPIEERAPAPPEKKGPTFEALAVFAFIVALAALMVAAFALGLAARSIDEHRAIPSGGGGSAGGSASVALAEFTITPSEISVPAGGVLTVANDGSVPHDLAVEGQDLATPELAAGDSATLDLSGLATGTYTVFCQIAGHREAGMVGTLTVG